MKLITVEEHYNDPRIQELTMPYMEKVAPFYAKSLQNLKSMRPPENLDDLGEARIKQMEKFGIDMQIISNTNLPQLLPKEEQVALLPAMNDVLAENIAKYPDRYRALAMLPYGAPEAAAAELKRCVKDYGFVGAMLPGRPVNEAKFFDDETFEAIFETAQNLDVPIYVHPGPPHLDVQKTYYEGFNPAVTGVLSVFAWGWHLEAGMQVLRMILKGVFDDYPNLKILSGHWGEMVPFYLSRLDHMLPPELTGLKKNISDYYKSNVYVTPSGMFDPHQFRYILDVLGADRIIYSVDYPYVPMAGAREFLENFEMPNGDREKVSFKNAEKLLQIKS